MDYITLNDLLLAVKTRIQELFSEIPVFTEPVPEDTEDAYFYVQLSQAEQTRERLNRYQRILSIAIRHQGSTGTTSALHQAAEALYDGLEELHIHDNMLAGTGLRHEILEGVLHFYITYRVMLRRSQEGIPSMSALNYEGGIKA